MALSNAERQAKYRARALKDPNGLMYIRLEVMLEAEYGNRLDEMVKASGKTKREIVQDAIRFFSASPEAPSNMGQIVIG